MQILLDEALSILSKYKYTPQYETIDIANALYRVIKHPINSPIPHPPFSKSLVDGWAYHMTEFQENITLDIHPKLVKAGDCFEDVLLPNECVKIMTGAKVPYGCNAVHRIELAQVQDNKVIFTKKENSVNIIEEGANLPFGEELFPVKILNSEDISILSSSGISSVEVAKMPRIGIVSTGNEILLPHEKRHGAKIFDSNGIYLYNICNNMKFPTKFLGIARDTEEELSRIIDDHIHEIDVFIFSGAVSVGDFDLVPSVLDSKGVQKHIHGIKIKPGKPFYFGTKDKTVFFGLPGNPVSTFVCFDVLIKPFLYQWMNLSYQVKVFKLPLLTSYTRKDTERKEYLPARLVQGHNGISVEILPYTGSTMTSVLSSTEVLVQMEIGVHEISQGELVYVRFL